MFGVTSFHVVTLTKLAAASFVRRGLAKQSWERRRLKEALRHYSTKAFERFVEIDRHAQGTFDVEVANCPILQLRVRIAMRNRGIPKEAELLLGTFLSTSNFSQRLDGVCSIGFGDLCVRERC